MVCSGPGYDPVMICDFCTTLHCLMSAMDECVLAWLSCDEMRCVEEV